MTTLETLIKAAKVRPTDLAAETDLSHRYLLMVRHGKVEPTVGRAIRIARAMTRLGRRRLRVEDIWPEAA